MAKRLTTDDHLAAVKQLRTAAPDVRTAGLAELLARPSLHGIVIKLAADLALDSGATSLAPALIAAARSLMAESAHKRDPGCEAKSAIAKALVTWETDAPDFFIQLAQYHQFEPTFGDPVDTAAECRGLAAIAIARLRPQNAIFILTQLLADERKTTRAHAAIALGLWPGPEAAALLHFKARIGDDEPEVAGEVFAALLRFDDPQFFNFIADQLSSKDQRTVEAAALALGQSKLPQALEPLTRAWKLHRLSRVATTLLMSIALLRIEPAVDFLVKELPNASTREALNILDALALYKSDPKLKSRLAPLTQSNPDLHEAFTKTFGT